MHYCKLFFFSLHRKICDSELQINKKIAEEGEKREGKADDIKESERSINEYERAIKSKVTNHKIKMKQIKWVSQTFSSQLIIFSVLHTSTFLPNLK